MEGPKNLPTPDEIILHIKFSSYKPKKVYIREQNMFLEDKYLGKRNLDMTSFPVYTNFETPKTLKNGEICDTGLEAFMTVNGEPIDPLITPYYLEYFIPASEGNTVCFKLETVFPSKTIPHNPECGLIKHPEGKPFKVVFIE